MASVLDSRLRFLHPSLSRYCPQISADRYLARWFIHLGFHSSLRVSFIMHDFTLSSLVLSSLARRYVFLHHVPLIHQFLHYTSVTGLLRTYVLPSHLRIFTIPYSISCIACSASTSSLSANHCFIKEKIHSPHLRITLYFKSDTSKGLSALISSDANLTLIVYDPTACSLSISSLV